MRTPASGRPSWLLVWEAAADERVELRHGELVEVVGGAVDEALLDQARACGGDALGAGAAELGGDLHVAHEAGYEMSDYANIER